MVCSDHISDNLKDYETDGSEYRFLLNLFFRDIFIILRDINQSAHISANEKIILDKGEPYAPDWIPVTAIHVLLHIFRG
jgi:hypothetical protein